MSGQQILDPSGAPIQLRGWNWGEWGSVQLGVDGAANAMQHANVVRVPLRWWGHYGDASVDARLDSAPGHIEPTHLTALDQVIKEATDNHLWVDLFVDSNCGQASVTYDTTTWCGAIGGAPANFANDPEMKQKFVELWAFLVGRYKDTPYIGMWEILPEPNFTCTAGGCKDFSTAPAFYASIIPTIRAIDPRTPIIVGPDGGYALDKIATSFIPGVDGLIYTGDILGAAATKLNLVTTATDFRAAKNVPVFIQQVGVQQSDMTPAATTDAMLSALGTAGIGWTWWTYRELHAPLGTGFAPWTLVNGTWTAAPGGWLTDITSHFN